MRLLRIRIIVILGAILTILYFTSDFALVDIEKSAIVVALGIDKADQGYKVTAQIATPQTAETASSYDDTVMTSTGKTVLEAVENIGSFAGWHPKLSFCSMIFIGRELAKTDIENVVEYFLTTERVENSAILAMSDTTAEDLLYAQTPLDTISSFALQKIVLKSDAMSGTVGATNLKTFAQSLYSKSKSGYMPVIDIIHGAAKGGESSQSEGSGGEKKDEVVFNASRLALFFEGAYVGQLSEEETLIYYFYKGPVYHTALTVRIDGVDYFLSADTKERSISVDPEKMTVDMKLTVKVATDDSVSVNDLTKFRSNSQVPEKTLKAVEEKLTSLTLSMFNKIADCNADILMIKDNVYKFKHSRYDGISEKRAKDFTPRPRVRVVSD